MILWNQEPMLHQLQVGLKPNGFLNMLGSFAEQTVQILVTRQVGQIILEICEG